MARCIHPDKFIQVKNMATEKMTSGIEPAHFDIADPDTVTGGSTSFAEEGVDPVRHQVNFKVVLATIACGVAVAMLC